MTRQFMTKDQRDNLLLVYLTEGFEAAKLLAKQYGVAPHYASNIARRRGYLGNRHRRHEHRWKRAIQAGEVHA